MNEKDLIKTLESLEENLNKLFENGMKKQEALVSNNIKLLENAVVTEEKFIRNIEITEKQRVSILTDLHNKFTLNNKSFKITDFLSSAKMQLDEKNAAQILKLKNRIQKRIISIEKLNQQNQFLIDTARDFIKLTISELVGPQRKSFLDKRV